LASTSLREEKIKEFPSSPSGIYSMPKLVPHLAAKSSPEVIKVKRNLRT
jgi:hypothetical protein